MFERVPAWSASHPWWTFLILVVVTAGLGAGAVTFGHQANIDEVFLPDGMAEIQTADEIASAFGERRLAFVMVRHESEAERVAPLTLQKLANLGDRLRESAVVLDVTSLATLVEDEAGRQLRSIPRGELRQILADLQSDPSGRFDQVSSGRFSAITLNLDPDASDARVVSELDAVLAAPGDWNPTQLSVTSAAHSNEAARQSGTNDLQLLMPLALAAMVLVLILLFGRFSDALLPLFTVLMATAWAYAALPLVGVPFSPLLYSVAPLVLGIGLDYGLHIVNGFRSSQRLGLDAAGAAREAGRIAGRPAGLTAITTAIGFGSFMASAIPQIRHWGILLVLGVVASLTLALTLLPALLRLAPTPKSGGRQDAPWLERLLERWGVTATRHWPPVITVVAFITIGSAILAAGVSIEPSLEPPTRQGAPYRAARDYEANFGGQAFLQVLIEGDPVVHLTNIDNFSAAVGGLSGVAFVDGPAQRARSAHNDTLPDNATYTAFLQGSNEQTLVSGDLSLIRVQYDGRDSEELARQVAGLAWDNELDARLTGRELIEERSQSLVLDSILLSTAIAFALVLAVLALVLRSLRGTITAFLPLMVVLVWQFGLLSLLEIPLNPVTGITTAMVIGVGIDFSLHMVHRARGHLESGLNPRAAAVAMVRSVGQPVLAGGVTTVTALVLLSLSENPQVAQFGRVAALVVASAMIVALSLVPILVTGRDTHGDPRTLYARRDAAPPAAPVKPTADRIQPPTPDAGLSMPPIPQTDQPTPWMQLRLRCPRCSLAIVFRVQGHEHAPSHLACPRCNTRHKLSPDQVYEPADVPKVPRGEAAFYCTDCNTEWRVGPVPAKYLARVKPGPCPSCGHDKRLRRYKPKAA